MPPKRKAPAASITEGNDGALEVQKPGRPKAASLSEPDHEEAGAAPASPVPLRKSGRKPKEALPEKTALKEEPTPDEKVVASKAKHAPKEKPAVKEKPSTKKRAAPSAKRPKEEVEGTGDEEQEEEVVALKTAAPSKKVRKGKEATKLQSDNEGQDEKPPTTKAKVKPPAKGKIAPGKKAAVLEKSEVADEDEGEGEDSENVKSTEVSNRPKKSVIIEHCKQCNAFKTRALQVQQHLQKAISGLEVVINPEKPRRGCFEIRDDEGNIFISLQGMPRPFTKLKALDMDETAASIVEQLK